LSDAINLMASSVEGRLEDAQRQANIDGLTQLYNRLYFYDRLAAEIQRADRFNSSFGIIFCDLDDFKLYNDQNGHTYGDSALQDLARIINASTRDVDITARYGGEEFAIILPEATSADSLVVAKRLVKNVAKHTFETKLGLPCYLTVSVGVVTYPEHGSSAIELVQRVDDAMYQAKRLGKNRVQLYNPRIRKSQPHNSGANESSNTRFLNYVKSLAAIVDARDRYCCSHSQTVARLARLIGEKMALGQEQLQDLAIAALLHDVGKIAISDAVLTKRTPLTLEEREMINQHPVMGSNIIRPVAASIDIVRSVLHHHEHFDGTGYPNGLSGREIPLGARIIAIADAYHAMISNRPYRPAFSASQALAELRANAEGQFDPEIVNIFARVVESGEIRDLEDLAPGSLTG
ncbi:MAG: diguanylate cyclase, partial [Firmicutes bacterium]|nr:diguanylate cyclase [Bacillota bacterium]